MHLQDSVYDKSPVTAKLVNINWDLRRSPSLQKANETALLPTELDEPVAGPSGLQDQTVDNSDGSGSKSCRGCSE